MKSIKSALTMACCMTLLCMAIFSGLGMNPAYAGPNCTKNPDHPKCGGGGDPGGEENTCADSLTFPTFAYWEDQGQSTITVLSLSDADGACTQALTEFDTEHYLTGDTAFHFDPVTRSGRVVFANHMFADFIFLVEFDVGDGNIVNVWNDSQPIVDISATDMAKGRIGDIDVSLDGDLMAFTYRSSIPDGYSGGYKIFTTSIDGCAEEPWITPGLDDCMGTLVEIISADPVLGDDGTFYWRDITLSTDNSKIYLDQFINALGGGTYVIEQVSGEWVLNRLEPLPFPVDIAFLDHDESGAGDVLATSRTSETNPCGELIIVDIEDCLIDNYCDSLTGQSSNVLGTSPSWLSDGRLVYEDRIYRRKGKNYSCSSGDMSIMAPLDPGSDPVNLFEGRGAMGWQ